MSDEIRKDGSSAAEPTSAPAPSDHQLFTPQGGGGGTGAAPLGAPPIKETSAGLTLPQVSPEGAGTLADAGEPGAGRGAEKPEASSFRLLMTLGMAGALAGALLVFVYIWSQPLIDAENARVLQVAVTEVLKGPDHFESLFLVDGELMPVALVPAGVDTLKVDRVFLAYDAAGEAVGYAMEAEGFGFQDIIGLIFGYDAENRQVLGMKVLRHLETPGLGDKIVKDLAFVGDFDGAVAPILGVKPDRNTGDPAQVDMITGATISSKAVIKIINLRIEELQDLLVAYKPTGGVQEEGR